MVLAMSRPWQDPKSGIWFLRKRVPKDLRVLVGRDVHKTSLGTKGAAEAKRRFPDVLAKLEARWANLRKGSHALSDHEIHDLAGVVYDAWLAQYRDDPSTRTWWRTDTYNQLWQAPPSWNLDEPMEERVRDLSRLVLSGQRMPSVIQVLAWIGGVGHGGQVSGAGE